MNQKEHYQDIYDDFELKKTLWLRYFFTKEFSALRVDTSMFTDTFLKNR